MAISLIRNFIAKEMMKKGKGITSVIPDARKVTFSADHLEKRLIQHGVDLNSIKSEGQIKQILAYFKQAEDKAFTERFGHTLKNNIFTKKGDVVDLTGKKIDTSKPILGGKNVPETDEQILKRFNKENKAAVQKMRLKKLRKDVLKEIENRKKEDYLPDIIDPEDYGFSVSDGTWTDEVEELMQMLVKDNLAGGGLAGMLGEPTYEDGGRVRYQTGAMVDPRMHQSYAQNVADQATQRSKNIAQRFFPEGQFQQIKADAPSQKDYNIQATADLTRNLPGGLLKDIVAPAAAGLMSIPYDAIQAAQRMEPGSGLKGFGEAYAAEKPLSSAWERLVGASAPLAERISGIDLGMSQAAAAEATPTQDYADTGIESRIADAATPTPDAGGVLNIPQLTQLMDDVNQKAGTTVIRSLAEAAEYLKNQKPTMADVAGPATSTGDGSYVKDGKTYMPKDAYNQMRKDFIAKEIGAGYNENTGTLDTGVDDWQASQNFDQYMINKYGYGNLQFAEHDPNRMTASEGGRAGFKDGYSPKRRQFLKLAAGLASIPFFGKFFKWAKPLAKTSKTLTSVPIGSAEGMPAWFKPLVNKVIKEGEDMSGVLSTAEREIVHGATLPGSKTKVFVTQSLDTGNVAVDIGMGKHGFEAGHLGQPVRLEYKASEIIEPTINKQGKVTSKGTKTKDEFWVEEAEFTGGHPENIKFEESTFEKFGEHGSNFDEVEMFATGKVKKSKPTKKKLRAEYESGKAEADAERWTDDLDMASGGRVPLDEGGISDSRVGMLWGGGIFKTIIQNLARAKGVNPSDYLKVTNYKSLPREVRNLMSKADFEKMKAGRLEMFENWVEMAKTRQRFLKSIEEGKRNTPHAAPIFEHLDKVHKSPVPRTVTDKDILQGEFILKNLKTKGRKLNATGGLAGMLGE